MNLEKKVTIHSHMRNSKKNHSQVKEDVQLKGIPRTSQKEFDKEIIEIKEGISYIERFIQENNEDQYCGWMMRTKKVQWKALQQKKIEQSMAWWKNEELKKAEIEQRLIKKEGM